MAVLSAHFSNTKPSTSLSVGTPPLPERSTTLSRKVKSELDLTTIGNLSPESISQSVFSEFSTVGGDPLPDEEGMLYSARGVRGVFIMTDTVLDNVLTPLFF